MNPTRLHPHALPRTVVLSLAAALTLASPLALPAPSPAADGKGTQLGPTPPTRAQALQALQHASPEVRFMAARRLGDIGGMADANRLVPLLRDDFEPVRQVTTAAMWRIWSRSGDKAIDALFERGLAEMDAAHLPEAITIFSEIIRRKPAFAEGWNKRATLYFIAGDLERSLKDCDEVMKRNPNHFGALSGYVQIHIQLGNPERALEYLQRGLVLKPDMMGGQELVQQLRQQIERKKAHTV